MKLIINSGSVFKGGSEQVALSFIYECRNYPQHEFHVVIGPNLASQIDQNEFPNNFRFYLLKNRPATSIVHFIKSMIWYRNLEKTLIPDRVISTGGHGYWRPTVPLIGGFNMAHYIYPESPFFNRMPFRKRLFWRTMKGIHMFFFNRLDAIIVQTEDVKDRLSKILSSKVPIFVISNTINAYFLTGQTFQNKIPQRKPGEIRLLTISSYYPHKNLEIIDLVTKALVRKRKVNFRFVVTLPEEKLKQLFGENGNQMIFNVGFVPIKECPSLYKECDFMFLPTLLECFTVSYLEAMVMKKPILTSDISFAHTICKGAAVYFDPLDPEDIANKIISLSEDCEKQNILISNGESIIKSMITPSERARKFLEICEQISNLI